MSRAVVVVLVLIVIALGGVYMYEASLEDAGENVTITGESWTPNAGSVTELEHSNQTGAFYDEEVTVYDSNGNEMEAGTDYRWFVGNGTVKALQGGGLDGETTATIDYGYSQTTEQHRDFANLVAYIPMLIGIMAPAFVAIIAYSFLRG